MHAPSYVAMEDNESWGAVASLRRCAIGCTFLIYVLRLATVLLALLSPSSWSGAGVSLYLLLWIWAFDVCLGCALSRQLLADSSAHRFVCIQLRFLLEWSDRDRPPSTDTTASLAVFALTTLCDALLQAIAWAVLESVEDKAPWLYAAQLTTVATALAQLVLVVCCASALVLMGTAVEHPEWPSCVSFHQLAARVQVVVYWCGLLASLSLLHPGNWDVGDGPVRAVVLAVSCMLLLWLARAILLLGMWCQLASKWSSEDLPWNRKVKSIALDACLRSRTTFADAYRSSSRSRLMAASTGLELALAQLDRLPRLPAGEKRPRSLLGITSALVAALQLREQVDDLLQPERIVRSFQPGVFDRVDHLHGMLLACSVAGRAYRPRGLEKDPLDRWQIDWSRVLAILARRGGPPLPAAFRALETCSLVVGRLSAAWTRAVFFWPLVGLSSSGGRCVAVPLMVLGWWAMCGWVVCGFWARRQRTAIASVMERLRSAFVVPFPDEPLRVSRQELAHLLQVQCERLDGSEGVAWLLAHNALPRVLCGLVHAYVGQAIDWDAYALTETRRVLLCTAAVLQRAQS